MADKWGYIRVTPETRNKLAKYKGKLSYNDAIMKLIEESPEPNMPKLKDERSEDMWKMVNIAHMSLKRVADIYGISRQRVHDLINGG